MTQISLHNLTSAEAGFLSIALQTGRIDPESVCWGVDKTAAGPLAAVFESDNVSELEADDEELTSARLRRWSRRDQAGKTNRVARIIDGALATLDEGESSAIQTRRARRRLQRAIDEAGGDVSKRSCDEFDLRRCFEDGQHESIEGWLLVIGVVLAASIEQPSIRRRLAAVICRLPPSIGEEVRSQISRLPPSSPPVARRVCEVYGRLAARGFDTKQELMLLGLFFVISAAVFRQNGAVDRLERTLSAPMGRHCRKFRRTCLRSGKPELFPVIADTIRSVVGGDTDHQPCEENSDE